MNTHIRKTILLSSLVLFVPSSALAQEAPAAGGKATITVTAIGKKDTAPAAVSKDDVQYLRRSWATAALRANSLAFKSQPSCRKPSSRTLTTPSSARPSNSPFRLSSPS